MWRGEICRDKLIPLQSPHRAPRYIHMYVMPRATCVRDHGLDGLDGLDGQHHAGKSGWRRSATPNHSSLNHARHRQNMLCRRSVLVCTCSLKKRSPPHAHAACDMRFVYHGCAKEVLNIRFRVGQSVCGTDRQAPRQSGKAITLTTRLGTLSRDLHSLAKPSLP